MSYFDGSLNFASTDVSGQAFGRTWSHTRTYGNLDTSFAAFGHGRGWFVSQTFAQVRANWDAGFWAEAAVMLDRQNVLWFTGVPELGRLIYKFGDDYRWLTRASSPEGSPIILAGNRGKRWIFHGKDSAHPNLQGRLEKFISTDGNETNLMYDSSTGHLLTYTEEKGGIAGTFTYAWNDSRITSVTLSVDEIDVERAVYTYHDGKTGQGRAGDLKGMVRERPLPDATGWFQIGESYYTYYTEGVNAGALLFALESEAMARLRAAHPSPATWDGVFAEFADLRLTYNANRQVETEVLRGGAESHTYSYFNREAAGSSVSSSSASSRLSSLSSASSSTVSYPAATNSWQRRTTEVTQDGITKKAYCNAIGEVMFAVTTGPDLISWYEAYRYDEAGRVILKATSAAVAGFDDTTEGKLFTLKPDEGLVYHYSTYEPSPNPDSLTKINQQELSEGELGTRVLLSKHSFKQHLVGSVSTDYLAKEDVYARNPESPGVPDDPDTTEYAYVWYAENSPSSSSSSSASSGSSLNYSGNLLFKERTTILPPVLDEQNGSGVSDTKTEVFAPNGQLLWSRDERGFISHYTYDDATGARVRMILDVDMDDAEGVPDGWETPDGGGLNLVTDYEHDDQGRITQELGPPHEIDLAGTATEIRQATWTVNRDDLRQQWIARGYATASEEDQNLFDTYVLIDPVQILQMDFAGRMISQISAPRTSGSGRLEPTDEFDQATGSAVQWSRWFTSEYDDQSRLVAQRVYHLIPAEEEGESGTNYAETVYGYDAGLRRNRVKTPGGTITRTVYLPRGMVQEVWVGTNDTGANDEDPAGSGAAGNNMVKVVENVCDGGASIGNGLLTQTTTFAGEADLRVTAFAYDFRDRRTATDGEVDFYEQYFYDNADRVIRVDRRHTDDEGNLIARNETAYDSQGRVYKTTRYGVNPFSGEVSVNALRELTWYNPTGQVMKQRSLEGGGFEKLKYDGIGRVVARYVACDPNPETYAQAGAVTGDIVLEQTEITYDQAGNVIEQRKFERNHDVDETVLVALTASIARVSFLAMYPDALGRSIATADYGTNGGVGWSRSATIPDSSDTCLVSRASYNSRGELQFTVDPKLTFQRQQFDDAGRQIRTVENYHEFATGADLNKTTLFGYNLDGKLVTLTAENSVTGDQVTQWVYGTTLEDSGVASFELLRAKIYPDSDDTASPLGDGPDEVYDRVEYRYNQVGELIEFKDQNTTVHQYEYDKLGRLLHDRVTAVGTGIDDAILRISRDYEVRGMLRTVTSADGLDVNSATVVNQVLLEYNAFGQLIADWQSHDARVTPVVRYTYADGSANSTRPLTIVYPNGRTIGYSYGENGTIDRLRGRIQQIREGGEEGDVLVGYTHRGIKSTVRIEYVEPGIEMTYIGTPGGDAGDQYRGLDRFGRIIDIRWMKTATTVDVDRFQYGFDRAGNRTWRRNVLGSSAGYDEQYTYDGLYQLADLKRGTLSGGSISSPASEEEFTYDPTGNWQQYVTRLAGSTTQDQTRTHNKANEIMATANPSVPLGYDGVGNMLRQGDATNDHHLDWDAWNRLVTVSHADDSVFARYQYDGLTRRIWKQTMEGGEGMAYRHFYYSEQWQVLEERFGDLSVAERQFVWGRRYADDLVLRDSPDPLPEYNRLYATHDQWHCTGLIAITGEAVQRYVYDAFGNPLALNSSFSPNNYFYYWEYRFGAYRWDWETETYQVRYRQYQPRLGRWLRRDPVESAARCNSFDYVGNRVVNHVDVLGLEPSDPVFLPKTPGELDCVIIEFFILNEVMSTVNRPIKRGPGTQTIARNPPYHAECGIQHSDGSVEVPAYSGNNLKPPITEKGQIIFPRMRVWRCCCLNKAEQDALRARMKVYLDWYKNPGFILNKPPPALKHPEVEVSCASTAAVAIGGAGGAPLFGAASILALPFFNDPKVSGNWSPIQLEQLLANTKTCERIQFGPNMDIKNQAVPALN